MNEDSEDGDGSEDDSGEDDDAEDEEVVDSESESESRERPDGDHSPLPLADPTDAGSEMKTDKKHQERQEDTLPKILGTTAKTQRSEVDSQAVDEDDTAGEIEAARRRKRKKRRPLGVNLNNCKYESVRRAARLCNLREVGEEEEWVLYWTDCSVSLDRVMEMKRFQKINHFPGMNEICRKDLLARNMNRLLKLFPKEFNIFPRTWCLPADYGDLQAYCRMKKNKTYICKPDSGCQGKGIFICRNPKELRHGDHMICQQYVVKPFLIDGFKFDLRVYVLVTSCDPLRIFVYEEGLARFATMNYIEPSNHNLDDICMHLTNYAINKHNENFIRDETMGSKRKLSTLNEWFKCHHYDTARIWEDIEDVIIKTLISAHPILKHNYRTCFPNHVAGSACFEILGFDILLDKKAKPWLLEVNHSPSFTTDSLLDREVKDSLLYDTINLINLRACDKKKVLEEDKRKVKERLFQRNPPRESRREQLENSQAEWLEQSEKYEDSHLGGFRRIFPGDKTDKYEKYFKHSGSLFQETAASKAREECARHQLEELRLKQEQREVPPGKKKKENKELLQGESAGEKNMPRRLLVKKPPARMSYSYTRTPEKKEVQIDIMKPIDIDEDEELERLRGLLQREKLIRELGVVDQIYRLLNAVNRRPSAIQIPETYYPDSHAKKQARFVHDFFLCQENEELLSHLPVSYLGATADLTTQAVPYSAGRSHQVGSHAFIPGFFGGVPPSTQYTLRRSPHQKNLVLSGGQNGGTLAGTIDATFFAKPLKEGGLLRFSSGRNKAEARRNLKTEQALKERTPAVQRGMRAHRAAQRRNRVRSGCHEVAAAKRPGRMNGVVSGSLGTLLPPGPGLPSTACAFPAVAGNQPNSAELELAITSAPIAPRVSHVHRFSPIAVHNLKPHRKWT
ncbi:tubulin polyglutamylase TTLL13 isoform X2 [Ambystoma mexicanum]|uniref:tubulin polyglutamylase TTLL13 isoform X2 n=1 Tax=Ambystoma mexicanum TaxID=8296 RepID=UPI0037E96F4C